MDLSRFPRVSLGHLPTPLERMDRLRAVLGPEAPVIYVKRDDCTGLATGGNKTRKLEFLMGEALAQGAGAVVTFGALQSNHARQTAAAAAKLGLACDLILIDMVARRDAAYRGSGNVLLDHIVGARVHVVAPGEAEAAQAAVIAQRAREGLKAYVVPIGGSNAIGALGYVAAFAEIEAQAKAVGISVDAIMHGTSSGGTQGGLMVGAALAQCATRIMGVNVYKKNVADVAGSVHALALETMQMLDGDLDAVTPRLHVIDGYVGDGYGMPSDHMLEAVLLTAQTEGLLLDPVYSGKAMAGLIGHVRRGKFTREQTVVFLHTGGTAALAAYADEFSVTPAN
jgi:D-cysteine desulfhydrase family pyridoxal phosphate-dependent enzyme